MLKIHVSIINRLQRLCQCVNISHFPNKELKNGYDSLSLIEKKL